MKNLYLAFRANTIDQVIETTPNEARYFVGYVGWRPGELKSEIDRGLWSVANAELEVIFRKDTEGLWEELVRRASDRLPFTVCRYAVQGLLNRDQSFGRPPHLGEDVGRAHGWQTLRLPGDGGQMPSRWRARSADSRPSSRPGT